MALPEWYEPDALEAGLPSQDEASDLSWHVVPAAESAVAPTPNEGESAAPEKSARRVMKNFHLRTHVSNPAARKAFRASRATYEDGHLEAGVIFNASKVPLAELNAKDRRFFERLTDAFPAVAERDVYVALEDEPTVAEDGILQLGPNPKVRVGKLSYSLAAVAKKLGISTAAARRDINREFRRMKVTDPSQLERLAPEAG